MEEKQQEHSLGAKVVLVLGVVISLVCILVIVRYAIISNSSKSKNDAAAAKMTDGLLTKDVEEKIGIIKDTIDEYYLDEYSDDEIVNGIYQGMIDSLGDKYADYYTQEELKQLMEDSEGIYYGIGAYISVDKDSDFCVITSVIENTPAEEAGVKAGDLIYKVDDVFTQGMESSEIVKLIKGDAGTYVHLSLIREGENDYVELDVERRKIDTPTVKCEMLEDNIGYIEVTTFDTVTIDQFAEAMSEIRTNDAKGLILDLRSNTGGSLVAVCEMCRELLPEGIIVYTIDKNNERIDYKCNGSRAIGIPIVVLVNGYTASASEIMTGALKDYGLATIVGTTTFGKGIVQKIIPLSDGTAVKMTISKYYTPSGVCIHGTGIEPDIEVELDADKYLEEDIDTQMDAAIEEMKKKIAAAE